MEGNVVENTGTGVSNPPAVEIVTKKAVILPVFPDINLHSLKDEELMELMLKLQVIFSQNDYEVHKRRRTQDPAHPDPNLPAFEDSLRATWRSMEVLAQYASISLFYSPPPPEPTPKTL